MKTVIFNIMLQNLHNIGTLKLIILLNSQGLYVGQI